MRINIYWPAHVALSALLVIPPFRRHHRSARLKKEKVYRVGLTKTVACIRTKPRGPESGRLTLVCS